jgi:hypothetical protein
MSKRCGNPSLNTATRADDHHSGSGWKVTNAVRSPVRAVTLWMRVVSTAVTFFLEGLRLNFALPQP